MGGGCRPNACCCVIMPATACRHTCAAGPGESDGSWAVDLPAEEVPAELPEPCLGINFARNGMQQRDWLALVAVHSDAWLLSVAFYYGEFCNVNGPVCLLEHRCSHPVATSS